MLAVGRALILNPRIILLDEPLEGLAPIIVDELAAAIGRLSGMALILVEQHAEIALALTREALVIERGRVTWQGSSSALANDERLLERALGVAGQT
jgi:branched-chain amino acid transport system ATP-binding protein